MIVVCTGCSAKFRVADEKIGPRGAKLRCSRCQTVFAVQPEVELPTATAPIPGAYEDPSPAPPPDSMVAGRLRATPPPLPRRTTTLDARAVFEVDLAPPPGDPAAASDPFAPLPPEPPIGSAAAAADPFAPPAPTPPPAFDPFAAPAAAGPAADPFGGPDGTPPPPPYRPSLDAGAPGGGADDALGGLGSISLEEATTPPARRVPRTTLAEPAYLSVMAATEDPFATSSALGPGLSVLDDGVLGAAAPAAGGEAVHAEGTRSEVDAEPIQLDPFGAAAVAADPLAVDEPARAAEPPVPLETTDERRAADRSFRIRDVAVSALALAGLLVLALAIVVAWRGGLATGDALRPSSILAALAPRQETGRLATRGVTSGLYDRARGAPLLFVRGTVVSTAATPLQGVRVAVELVRDGAVLIQGEVPAGAVPGPEALHGAVDAESLARALAEAAPAGGTGLGPGGAAPFLIAFDDYPPNLEGASLRVRAVADEAR